MSDDFDSKLFLVKNLDIETDWLRFETSIENLLSYWINSYQREEIMAFNFIPPSLKHLTSLQ